MCMHPIEIPSRTTVVFIGGAGRSGSTVIENMLANCERIICVGEAKTVFSIGLRENPLMPSGVRFKEDKFWLRVIETGWGGIDQIDIDRIEYLQRTVDKTLHLVPNELPLFRTENRKKLLSEYRDHLSRLYKAIAAAGDADVVVDTTKWPIYGSHLIRSSGLDVRLIHLIRDPRAVYRSWRTPKIRPEKVDAVTLMVRPTPLWIVTKWIESNLTMAILCRDRKNATLLRYENFAKSPKASLVRALQSIGLEDVTFYLKRTKKFHWGRSKSMRGNPVRFSNGEIFIKEDLRWIELSAANITLSITLLPFLKFFGYPLLYRSKTDEVGKLR